MFKGGLSGGSWGGGGVGVRGGGGGGGGVGVEGWGGVGSSIIGISKNLQ